jgi:hypothetical protein
MILDPKLIQCDSGWNKIILNCHKELSEIDPFYEVLQIKEKFGGLRYYFQPQTLVQTTIDKMYDVVRKYESLSLLTCEKCGEPGNAHLLNDRWMKTYCEKHKK